MILYKHGTFDVWRIGRNEIYYDPTQNRVAIEWGGGRFPPRGYSKASKESLRVVFSLIWEAKCDTI